MRHVRFLALAVFALWGCTVEIGSGRLSTESRELDSFNRIAIHSGIRAEQTLGPQSFALTTDDNLLKVVETWVADRVLNVRVRPDVVISSTNGVRAVIASEELTGIEATGGSQVMGAATEADQWRLEASGGSQVTVTGIVAARSNANASGGSRITAGGVTTELTAEASGGSKLLFDGLAAQDVTLEGSGGSQLEVRASGSVRGDLSGGSQAFVSGSPVVREVNVSGGSQVEYGAR